MLKLKSVVNGPIFSLRITSEAVFHVLGTSKATFLPILRALTCKVPKLPDRQRTSRLAPINQSANPFKGEFWQFPELLDKDLDTVQMFQLPVTIAAGGAVFCCCPGLPKTNR